MMKQNFKMHLYMNTNLSLRYINPGTGYTNTKIQKEKLEGAIQITTYSPSEE